MYSECKKHCEKCKYGKYDGGYYDEYYCNVSCPNVYDSLCLNCISCEYKDTCKSDYENEIRLGCLFPFGNEG